MTRTWLTPDQHATLTAVCEALAPTALFAVIPPDTLAAQVAGTIADRPPTEQRSFCRLLDLLGGPLADFSPMDRRSFRDRLPAERDALLYTYATSRLGLRRKGFQTLKRLVHFLAYAAMPAEDVNPTWSAVGYPGPPGDPPTEPPTPITPLTIERETTLTCDVVVVGSGAGGGLVAGELAAAGFDVVVLEKGEFVAEDEFTHRELEMTRRLYEAQGFLTTDDLGVIVLAGSCLGGGTVVNWSASFRTPDPILEEWARRHDVPHFVDPYYTHHFDAVEARLHVTTDDSPRNPQNDALRRGCEALGWQVKPIPRNVRACDYDVCSYCTFGCRHGAKQSTLRTYLADAAGAGARIVTNCTVRRVRSACGRATGVRAVVTDRQGRQHLLTVRAPQVVVAAGAIHTPALLRRSGIVHPHLGRHLRIHPTIPVSALYDEPIDPWRGVPMATISTEFAYLDGTYGVRLETPPAHPGTIALALPWAPGGAHEDRMNCMRNHATFIVLVRDRDGGRVTLDARGDPVLHYRISDYDRKLLCRGIAAALRAHRAAGAREFIVPGPVLRTLPASETAIAEIVSEVEAWDGRPNWLSLFTAHQMSSCRMGGRRGDHVVSPSGQVWGMTGVYVADASALPSASGVNPMLSIQALARHVSECVRADATSR